MFINSKVVWIILLLSKRDQNIRKVFIAVNGSEFAKSPKHPYTWYIQISFRMTGKITRVAYVDNAVDKINVGVI